MGPVPPLELLPDPPPVVFGIWLIVAPPVLELGVALLALLLV